jgi:Protein of unknown function (DUF2634)
VPDVDEGFSPLPAFSQPVDPLAELTLEDALADDEQPAEIPAPPAPLGRAPAYDFIEHRFIPSVAGGPLMTRGTATLATWVEKCLRTRRGESPAVDPDFGCDIVAEDLLEEGEPFDASAVAEYVDAIKRALLTHPRISDIEGLSVEGSEDDDAVIISLRVVTDGDDLSDLTIDRLSLGA